MVLHIQPRHFNPGNELIAFITKKINKLCRFNRKITEGEVRLIVEDGAGPRNKICEIKLVTPGNDIYASARGNTFEEATAKNVDAIQQQIGKGKVR